MFKIILIGLVITVVGLFALTKIDPNIPNNIQQGTTIKDGQKKVVITGQVTYPGEYIVLPTDTLDSLIKLAGGLLEDADQLSFTATIQIGDYTEFYIPPTSKTPDTCLVENINKVNINTATVEKLKEIGLTATQSNAIVEYRTANGEFKTIEDIQLVSGIGPKTYLNVRDYITIK